MFQFPLYKLFLIVAAYAAAFAAFGKVRAVGIIDAVIVGTLSSILIILVRTRNDIRSAIYTAVGSLLGTVPGAIFACRVRVIDGREHYEIADAILDWCLMSAGAIIGGYFASRRNRR